MLAFRHGVRGGRQGIRTLRTAILIACAAAVCDAISACGPNPVDDAGAAVDASALPHPKPGLWQWNSRMAGSRQLCLSGQLLTVFAERPGCPVVRRVKTSDGAFIVEAACSAGAVK